MGWTVRDLNPGSSTGFYLLQKCPYRLWVSPSLILNGYWCSSLELERPDREVFHSPVSTADLYSPSTPSWRGQGQIYLSTVIRKMGIILRKINVMTRVILVY